MTEEKKELIVVKQLPIIEERLKELSVEIDKKISNAIKLECNEENYKDIKKVRTELRKDFDFLESKRKEVKNAVLTPYNNFEEIYKQYVSDKFKNADNELKTKIYNVEAVLLTEKEENVKQYFEELKTKNNIDFINYEQLNIKVGLTDSKKSIMKEIDLFFEKLLNELQAIEIQENKEEILVEYMKDLNLTRALRDVSERHKALEQVKEQQALKEEQKLTDEQVIAKVDSLLAPKIEEVKETAKEILEISFKVRGTREKLKLLKVFLENGGYDYE